jgi:hypothetical protein
MKKVKAPTLTEAQEYWLLLDRERYSRDREVFVPQVEPQIRVVSKPCTRQHIGKKAFEVYGRLMFDAGRYAAGARDKSAVDAYAEMLRRDDAS